MYGNSIRVIVELSASVNRSARQKRDGSNSSCFLCILYDTNIHMISIQTTDVFDAWLAGLKDKRAVARILARIDRAEDGNFGDCSPVGEGV